MNWFTKIINIFNTNDNNNVNIFNTNDNNNVNIFNTNDNNNVNDEYDKYDKYDEYDNNNVNDEYDKYDKYDEYDIIDFFEVNYIEYLNSIPIIIWSKYKKNIEIKLLEVNNLQIINLVLEKIKIDPYNYILKNIMKINFELFKILINIDKKKIIDKIIKNEIFVILVDNIFKYQNLDFNKYMYKNLYEDIKKNQNYKNQNYEIKIITNYYQPHLSTYLPTYLDVFYYYIEIFNLKNTLKCYTMNTKKNLYLKIFNTYSVDSLEKIVKFKNLFEIDDAYFVSNVLCNSGTYFIDNIKEGPILFNICKSGNIELFIKIINNFNIKKNNYTINNNYMILYIFINATLSKNINFIIIIYNYLKFNIKIDFTIELLSHILHSIVINTTPKHHEYDDIIYEFLNLGAIIKGYGEYTDYIKSIKFLNKSDSKN